MGSTSGSRKINFAELRTEKTRPTIDELEVFVMLARTAEVPGDTPVVVASQKLTAEAIVSVTSTFDETPEEVTT